MDLNATIYNITKTFIIKAQLFLFIIFSLCSCGVEPLGSTSRELFYQCMTETIAEYDYWTTEVVKEHCRYEVPYFGEDAYE